MIGYDQAIAIVTPSSHPAVINRAMEQLVVKDH